MFRTRFINEPVDIFWFMPHVGAQKALCLGVLEQRANSLCTVCPESLAK